MVFIDFTSHRCAEVTCVSLLHRSTFHTSDHGRAHDLLRRLVLWVGLGPLHGIPQVLVAKTLAEQRDTHRCQHYGLGQRSAQALHRGGGEGSSGVNPRISVWTKCFVSGCPQDLDFSCWWTWFASFRCHTLSSSVTAASPTAPLLPLSFSERRTATRRTHPPKQPWTSLRRTTSPQKVTLTSLYSQNSREWDVKEQRKASTASWQLTADSWQWYLLPNVLRYLVDRRHQRSNEIRELSLLAYLSQMQSPDLGPVRPLQSLVPYQVCDVHRAN